MSSGRTADPASGPARWRRVQDLFHAAADLPAAEQRAFLESRSDGDTALIAEVEALLVEDRTPGSFLDRSLPEVANHLLGGETPGRVGPYRILRLLGEGGLGDVYLVEREDVGGRAALKLLRDAWVSPSRRARFLAEQTENSVRAHPSGRLSTEQVIGDFGKRAVEERARRAVLDEEGFHLRDQRRIPLRA